MLCRGCTATINIMQSDLISEEETAISYCQTQPNPQHYGRYEYVQVLNTHACTHCRSSKNSSGFRFNMSILYGLI